MEKLELGGDKIINTKDILPADHKYLTFLKKVFRHEFRKNGFRRLSTPFFDDTNFFEGIFGEKMNDNMYNFNLEGNGNVGLTPNPSILNFKAYIENERSEEIQPVYSYFMDRFYPKNNQNNIDGMALFGGDVIGEHDVIIDIQNLFITTNILNKVGLKGKYEVIYNFIGNNKEIDKYKENLAEFYSDKKHLLSDEGLNLLETDILKLFSTKNEDEQILKQTAPKISKCYKKESKKDVVKAKEFLEFLDLDYTQDDYLFPQYEFNDGVVWEIRLIGDEKTEFDDDILAKGYGYNQLSLSMGTPKEIPGSGFWVDTFKIIDILKKNNISIKNKDNLDLFFIQLGDDAKKVVFPISIAAREAGIKTAISLGTPSIKEQMLKAQRSEATYIVIVGFVEAKKGIFQVRNLEDGTQEEIPKDELIEYIINKIGKDSLDFYDPSKELLEEK